MTNDLSEAIGLEALETLRLMLMDDDVTDSSRVAAAKALLDRFTPKDDAERKRRETEERDAALIEARGLLAELALAKSAGAYEPPALAENGATEPDHA